MALLRILEPSSGDLVVFPELSLSNYDPDVADSVAIEPDHRRLDILIWDISGYVQLPLIISTCLLK